MSLDQVEAVVRDFHGSSEIDYERAKAERRSQTRATMPGPGEFGTIEKYAAEAASRRVDYLTVRRIAEMLNASDQTAMAELRRLLSREYADRYDPPVFRTDS